MPVVSPMKASIHFSSPGRYFSIIRFMTSSQPQRSVENVPSKSHTIALIDFFMMMTLYNTRRGNATGGWKSCHNRISAFLEQPFDLFERLPLGFGKEDERDEEIDEREKRQQEKDGRIPELLDELQKDVRDQIRDHHVDE